MPGSHYLSDVICAAVVGFCSLSFARVLPSIATRRGTLAASIPDFPARVAQGDGVSRAKSCDMTEPSYRFITRSFQFRDICPAIHRARLEDRLFSARTLQVAC